MFCIFNIPHITEFGSNELYKQKFQLHNNFSLERHITEWGYHQFYGENPDLKPKKFIAVDQSSSIKSCYLFLLAETCCGKKNISQPNCLKQGKGRQNMLCWDDTSTVHPLASRPQYSRQHINKCLFTEGQKGSKYKS